MEMSTRKFLIEKSETPGMMRINDRHADSRTRIIPFDRLPSVDEMANMTTEQFDDRIHKLVYCT